MDGMSNPRTAVPVQSQEYNRTGITFLVCDHCQRLKGWWLIRDGIAIIAAGCVIAGLIMQCWPK